MTTGGVEYPGELVLDTDTTACGVVWVAAGSTVGLVIATMAAALAGFQAAPVLALGASALTLAVLTIAAAIHNPRYAGLPLVDDGDGCCR